MSDSAVIQILSAQAAVITVLRDACLSFGHCVTDTQLCRDAALFVVDDACVVDGQKALNWLQSNTQYQGQPILWLNNEDPIAPWPESLVGENADFICGHVEPLDVSRRLRHLLTQSKSRQLAERDPLTGLLSRQHYAQQIQNSLRRRPRNPDGGAVLMIDLDNFNRVNSHFSYDDGDRVLQLISNRLASGLRASDVLLKGCSAVSQDRHLARVGGDEFTLFLDGIEDQADAIRVAQRCMELIAAPLEIQGQQIVLQASVGIACYPLHGDNVNSLLRNAERAMYVAKKSGGNVYTLHDSALHPHEQDHFSLEQALRSALSDDQLYLLFQPQLDTQTGKVISLEALCRWQHPELGQISPARFIPLAEQSGLIVPIGEWVLRSACRQAADWLETGLDFKRIAVNVSAYQFNRADFVQSVRDVLLHTGLPARCLELELTESIIMSDVEENISKLEQLRVLGVHLAVDDFGTGYSSLSYLKRLPINTLKIDRTFVTNIGKDYVDSAIVSAILALARQLGLQVIAEGVENVQQLNFFKKHQCAMVQGYYFSQAVEPVAIEAMLRDDQPLLAAQP